MHSDAKSGMITFHRNTAIFDTVDSTITIQITTDSAITIPVLGSSGNEKDSIALGTGLTVPPKKTKNISGVASYYNKSFEGAKTATGETFRNASFTGASNNFPLNTWVRVTNLKNGKSVIVRINDRMHTKMSKKGRVVDLTTTAAKKIGLTSKIGLMKVSVQEVEKGTTE